MNPYTSNAVSRQEFEAILDLAVAGKLPGDDPRWLVETERHGDSLLLLELIAENYHNIQIPKDFAFWEISLSAYQNHYLTVNTTLSNNTKFKKIPESLLEEYKDLSPLTYRCRPWDRRIIAISFPGKAAMNDNLAVLLAMPDDHFLWSNVQFCIQVLRYKELEHKARELIAAIDLKDGHSIFDLICDVHYSTSHANN
jgi:hypothetical protein